MANPVARVLFAPAPGEEVPEFETPSIETFYQSFMKKYEEDWAHNSSSAFTIPRQRAFACATIIEHLIRAGENDRALTLFNSTQERHAWNPKIGYGFDSITTEKCNEFFNSTRALLVQHGLLDE